ncbi:MAG: tetratricopeptide repeat protein [Sphingomonas sp.]
MASRFGLLAIAAAWAACAALPAQAQDALAELDALSAASADAGSGIALARQQIGDGDLVGATATLERVLMDHPDADEALLLHASLLCRLDDKDGARAEVAALGPEVAVADADWREVTAACGPVPRPAGGY